MANNLGVIGPVYPILEMDLLEWIKVRLKLLPLDIVQKKFQQTVIKKTERPQAVSSIQRATYHRTFYFDPTITLPRDWMDHQGRLFQKAGTTMNPLTLVPLRQSLLFFDADDKEEVRWAHKMDEMLKHQCKLILVKGSVTDQMKQWGRSVYFDQGGFLVKKLGIEQSPALVRQKGFQLEINEFKML